MSGNYPPNISNREWNQYDRSMDDDIDEGAIEDEPLPRGWEEP